MPGRSAVPVRGPQGPDEGSPRPGLGNVLLGGRTGSGARGAHVYGSFGKQGPALGNAGGCGGVHVREETGYVEAGGNGVGGGVGGSAEREFGHELAADFLVDVGVFVSTA